MIWTLLIPKEKPLKLFGLILVPDILIGFSEFVSSAEFKRTFIMD
jgi:hypothetical protein